jgi:hypothetical protein
MLLGTRVAIRPPVSSHGVELAFMPAVLAANFRASATEVNR